MSTNNIQVSGGIFTHHFIESLLQDNVNHPALRADTFTFAYQTRISERDLENRISLAWTDLVERWDALEREFNALDISMLRQKWIRPLLSYLGFFPEFIKSDIVLDDDFRFPITYLASVGNTEISVPVHSVRYNVNATLETKTIAGRGIKAMAPHDMMQRYLNLSKEHDWGFVTDGIELRLLRDFHHSYTRGFTEFDLQGIFSTRDFASFRAMYRLLHASRFFKPEEKEAAPIDELYEDALAMGVAVGNKLRGNVQSAIETLANGFLSASSGFMDQVRKDPDGSQQLYHDILITIYRVLFLLFAEQRGMLPGRGSLYNEEFSLTAFRTLAEQPRSEDANFDLWEKLKTSFSMVEHGVPELKIFAYNGALFSLNRTSLLTPDDSDNAPRCRNDALLTAIRHLTTVDEDHVLQRISYSDLSVEEIGSIYESLLEITPRINEKTIVVDDREILPNTFYLDPRGKGRKTTGSYYTPPSLVNELIKSALEPVMYDRIKAVVPGYESDMVEVLTETERELAEEAILKIKVVDPAAGSGAFLIAATNKLGLELARIRSASIFPPEDLIRHARRDVLTHCIHGVDLNPMAVELCKVSLWINAAVEDAPLNFLDHHIQCGNSLVGTIPELVKQGIPNEAYTPVTGDDSAVANSLKRENRQVLLGQQSFGYQVTVITDQATLKKWIAARELAESKPSLAEKAFMEYQASQDTWDERLPNDLWTAAFFVSLQKGQTIPTTLHVRQALKNPKSVPTELKQLAKELAIKYRFFHWHLAFPEVFEKDGKGGFDVMLGNPPWERVKLQEKEFFEGKDDSIVNAPNASVRKRLITGLSSKNPTLWRSYQAALHYSESESNFFRQSNVFPLGGRGDINLYQIFAEKSRHLISSKGRAGIIVPTGIATDDTCKYLFGSMVEQNQIASLFDFENRKKLFSEVDGRMKFSLLTLKGTDEQSEIAAKFAFFLYHPDDLQLEDKIFELTAEDFYLLNPNTKTCPIFRTKTDAELTRKLYNQTQVIINDELGINPLNISFGTMFHSMNHASLLFTDDYFNKGNYQFFGNRFYKTNETFHPLVEGKSFAQYDHRFANIEISETALSRPAQPIETTLENHKDLYFLPKTRAWVSENEIENWKITKNYNLTWYLVYKKITSATNERTVMSTIVPESAIIDTVHILMPNNTENLIDFINILGFLNSFVFDYVCRQKLGGTALSFYVFHQLPIISRTTDEISKRIIMSLLELIYTSWDMYFFAVDLWKSLGLGTQTAYINILNNNQILFEKNYPKQQAPGWLKLLGNLDKKFDDFSFPPFVWDEKRRFELRSDLDALIGHLYNLTRDEFDYILDTFTIVHRKDESQYGEYRTKRIILEKFDALADDPILEGACIPLSERVSVLKNPEKKQSAFTPLQKPHAPKPFEPQKKEYLYQPKTTNPKKVIREDQPTLFDPPAEKVNDVPPSESDYSLYRCPICNKFLPGFSLDEHTRDVHKGQDPGYKKF